MQDVIPEKTKGELVSMADELKNKARESGNIEKSDVLDWARKILLLSSNPDEQPVVPLKPTSEWTRADRLGVIRAIALRMMKLVLIEKPINVESRMVFEWGEVINFVVVMDELFLENNRGNILNGLPFKN